MGYLLIGSKGLTKYMIKEHSNGNILADGVVYVDTLSEMSDVFSHQIYHIDADSNIDYQSMADTVKGLLTKNIAFRIKCFVHGSNKFNKEIIGYGSRDIEVNVGKLLESDGFVVNLELPSITIIINIVDNKSYITKINGGYFEHSDRVISRAQLKLAEAFDYFKIDKTKMDINTALDIGAAPGGFSYEMSKLGIRVDAVDPGLLDAKLINSNITHIKKKIEDFSTNKIYDIITDDMNISPLDSVRSILKLKENIRKNGICIITVKCVNKRSYSYYMKQVSMELKDFFKDIRFKHMPHNRTELTMFALRV